MYYTDRATRVLGIIEYWSITRRFCFSYFTRRSVRLMVLYDVTTGWLTWVNQSLADGTDPRSGRNLFNKARHARFEGDLSQRVLL